MKPFGACERKWATMHARPFEHNNADHNLGRRNTQGDKRKIKKYDPRTKNNVFGTKKMTEDELNSKVPPRLSALAIHPLVEEANPATVRVLHRTTRHR
jgi:hypothetical protein